MAEGGKKWNAQDIYDPNMPVSGRTGTGSRTSQSPPLPPNQPQCGHFGNVIGQEGRRNENPTESNIRAESNHRERIDFRVNGSTQPLDCQGNLNYWELTSLPSDVYEDRLESSTGYDQGPHAPGPPSLMSFQLPRNSTSNGDDLGDTHRGAAPAYPMRVQTRSEDNRTAICPPIYGPHGDRNEGNTLPAAGNNSQDNIRQLRGRTRSTAPTSSQPTSLQAAVCANSSRNNNMKPGTGAEYIARRRSYEEVIRGNSDLQEAVNKWADVGFYHTKVGDRVKCQYCNGATDFDPDLSESKIWDFHDADCSFKEQERQDGGQDSSSSESNSTEGRDASIESIRSQEGAVGGISMERSRSPKVVSSSDEEMVEDPRLNYRKEADGNASHGATGTSTHIAGIHYPPPVASFLSPVHGPSTQCPGGRESATDFTIGSNLLQETSHFQTAVFPPTQSFTDQMAGASGSTLLSTGKKRQYHAAVDSLVDMGCSRKKATEIVDRYGEVYGYDISNLTEHLPT